MTVKATEPDIVEVYKERIMARMGTGISNLDALIELSDTTPAHELGALCEAYAWVLTAQCRHAAMTDKEVRQRQGVDSRVKRTRVHSASGFAL